MTDDKCLFCRIIKGEIPSDKVYEDEHIFVFKDINPKAPVHFLIVPKQHIDSSNEFKQLKKDQLARLLTVIPELAEKHGLADSGYRTIINCGSDAGQEVQHLHVHLLGGKKFTFFA